ncbi:MAG: DUF5667 domain-containing protein [Nocardioides sp.]
MTWGLAAQRRADEFEALVEGRTSADVDRATRDAELLELVGALRSTPEIHARPEFVTELREQLMAEAATALAPADVSRLRLPERRPHRERRLAAVVGGIAIVGATTSVAIASQSALPGDSLYPIKRAIEGAHAGLSVGESNKGTTVLSNASDRLDEVDALARQDGAVDDLRIATTLNAFTDQATQASDLLLADYAHTGDESSITALRDFSTSSLAQLAALEPVIPDDARDELVRAAQILQTIDAQAAQRCPACGGAPISTLPDVLTQAGEILLLPPPPPSPAPATSGKGDGQGGKQGGKQGKGGQDQQGSAPELPTVPSDGIGPGSVLNPSTAPTSGPGGTQNPIQSLTEGLTDGLKGAKNPSGQPSVPVVGPLLGTVGDLLEGIVNPLTGTIEKP